LHGTEDDLGLRFTPAGQLTYSLNTSRVSVSFVPDVASCFFRMWPRPLDAIQQDADGFASAATEAAEVTVRNSSCRALFLSLLTAGQAYQQAVLDLVRPETNRYTDIAALFQAFGGGQSNRLIYLKAEDECQAATTTSAC
jgi:hypothetical protein